jgi:hypothetical protein
VSPPLSLPAPAASEERLNLDIPPCALLPDQDTCTCQTACSNEDSQPISMHPPTEGGRLNFETSLSVSPDTELTTSSPGEENAESPTASPGEESVSTPQPTTYSAVEGEDKMNFKTSSPASPATESTTHPGEEERASPPQPATSSPANESPTASPCHKLWELFQGNC